MTTALITGANGHIGCHVARAVAERGWTPVGFVRPGSDRQGLAGLDLELREGDLLKPESLAAAMRGVDVVFHVAAPHRNFATDESTMERPMVEGTRNVLAAAGDRRVVCTSTGATVGFAADPAAPLTEAAPRPTLSASYARSKQAAEDVALEAARAGQDVLIVNPSGVFGPRDHRQTPATRSLIGLLQGDPAFLAVSVTDVRDVATGHVLAAERGEAGTRTLLTGELLVPDQLAVLMGQLAGKAPSTFRPPGWLLRFLAGRQEAAARRTGEDAGLTRAMVDDVFGRHLAYDSTRARQALGWSPRGARETLTDAFRWLLFVDALKPKVATRVRGALGDAADPDLDWVVG